MALYLSKIEWPIISRLACKRASYSEREISAYEENGKQQCREKHGVRPVTIIVIQHHHLLHMLVLKVKHTKDCTCHKSASLAVPSLHVAFCSMLFHKALSTSKHHDVTYASGGS